jgi:uncharacterized membrane protein
MNKRNRNLLAGVSYITWIGFFVAFFMGDRTDPFHMHHMNQALVINIVSIIGGVLAVIPILGAIAAGVVSIGVLIYDVLGVYRALTGNSDPLPFIGDYHLIG